MFAVDVVPDQLPTTVFGLMSAIMLGILGILVTVVRWIMNRDDRREKEADDLRAAINNLTLANQGLTTQVQELRNQLAEYRRDHLHPVRKGSV